MPNRHRGEIDAELGGTRRTLVLTLGALAELESAFGAEDLPALAERFGSGRLKARDLVRIIGAGLRGAGETITDDAVARLPVADGAAGYVRIAAELLAATFGEVRREGAAFTAELRGLADRLNAENGSRYTAACAADLGDARCTMNLADPAFRGEGCIASLSATSTFIAAGLDAFADTWFSAGRLVFTSGANNGLAVEVKRHRVDGGNVAIELWQAMPEPLAVGDRFTVTAGCDKRLDTCRSRFDNVVNFRGFPHIPGNDFVTRYAVSGQPGNDGSSLQS